MNAVGGPDNPYGASNWPWIEDGDGAYLAAPTLDRPDSPCVISTVLAYPALIAAAACLTCSRKDVPPTAVPSIQRGTMPSECATWTGPGALTVAIPSMSLTDKPGVGERVERGLGVQLQGGVIRQLADPVGLSGSRDDDAAHAALPHGTPRKRREQRQADIAALLERDPQRHVEHEVLRGIGHPGQVGHHPWPLGQLDDGDRVRRLVLESRRWPVVDHVRVQGRLPARGEPLHPRRAACRADRARVEVRLSAVQASLDP